MFLNTVRFADGAAVAKERLVGPSRQKHQAQGSIKAFGASPAQQASFNRNMAMACITGCVPFNFFSNIYLQAAAADVGVKLISRKVLSSTLLDSIFEEVELGTATSLASLQFIDGSSDGWRKKACDQGAGLMNFCALTLVGALFWDAVNCSALRKDKVGIANLLEEKAIEMSGGDPKRFAGWILDNTKANWGAMMIMTERHPQWINRGCIAHGLSLAMKDFTKYERSTLCPCHAFFLLVALYSTCARSFLVIPH